MTKIDYAKLQTLLGGEFPEEFQEAVSALNPLFPPGWRIEDVTRSCSIDWGFDIKLRIAWDVEEAIDDAELHGCFLFTYGGGISTEHLTLSRIHMGRPIAMAEYDTDIKQYRSIADGSPIIHVTIIPNRDRSGMYYGAT